MSKTEATPFEEEINQTEAPVEAGNGYKQGDQFDSGPSEAATTEAVGAYESPADEVVVGKWPAIFQGAEKWRRDGVEKLVLKFKFTDGPNVNRDEKVWITEIPKAGSNPTPIGILNAFQEAFGWQKGPSKADPSKITYTGNFNETIGTPLYLDVVKNNQGFTNLKPSKADEHCRKCAERFQ